MSDEAWCALASLHRDHPDRSGFTAKEILQRAEERAGGAVRPGLQVHIYLHNVANLPPNSARYRLFYRLADNTYRLYRPGDDHDPRRGGKTKPERADLPTECQELLDFYESTYCTPRDPLAEDPVLQMLGVGAHLWREESGDEYIRKERAAWDENSSDPTVSREASQPVTEEVWQRIRRHEGEEFLTAKGLPFVYQVDGNGLWFYREGRKINQRLSRREIDEGVQRCPVSTTTELNDLRDYAYLFAVLRDTRISKGLW